MTTRTEVRIDGKKLALSNLDKILYPKARFTKGQIIDYYTRVAPVLVPHLKDRPLTLKRYPEGVDKEFFYEKHCPTNRPSWVKTASVWSKTNHSNMSYCMINNLPSLVWAVNLADLELHTSLARVPKLDQPTAMVFDLDPGSGADVLDCAEVAIKLRDLLQGFGLECFCKTSGSKGLQVYVPLNSTITFDQTKSFARNLAETLAREWPEKVVSQMAKRLRPGKVFIDWIQNDANKTTVCVYSLRAKELPTVSTPLNWTEVESAFKSGSAPQLSFEAEQVIKRIQKFGDLFAPVMTLKQRLLQES